MNKLPFVCTLLVIFCALEWVETHPDAFINLPKAKIALLNDAKSIGIAGLDALANLFVKMESFSGGFFDEYPFRGVWSVLRGGVEKLRGFVLRFGEIFKTGGECEEFENFGMPLNFNASRAHSDFTHLAASPRYIGDVEYYKAVDFISNEMKSLRSLAEMDSSHIFNIDVDVAESQGLDTIIGANGKFITHAYNVSNVIVRIRSNPPSTESNPRRLKTHVFCAHFDSHWNGYGASDDVVNVAILMETARYIVSARKSGEFLFLFSGGEEYGLLGAHGLIKHPFFNGVKVDRMMNLESIGSGGIPVLFRHSLGFESLFGPSQRFHAYPLLYDLYKLHLIGSDTEYTVLEQEFPLAQGVEFVMMKKPGVYHTSMDCVEGFVDGSLEAMSQAVVDVVDFWCDYGDYSDSGEDGGETPPFEPSVFVSIFWTTFSFPQTALLLIVSTVSVIILSTSARTLLVQTHSPFALFKYGWASLRNLFYCIFVSGLPILGLFLTNLSIAYTYFNFIYVFGVVLYCCIDLPLGWGASRKDCAFVYSLFALVCCYYRLDSCCVFLALALGCLANSVVVDVVLLGLVVEFIVRLVELAGANLSSAGTKGGLLIAAAYVVPMVLLYPLVHAGVGRVKKEMKEVNVANKKKGKDKKGKDKKGKAKTGKDKTGPQPLSTLSLLLILIVALIIACNLPTYNLRLHFSYSPSTRAVTLSSSSASVIDFLRDHMASGEVIHPSGLNEESSLIYNKTLFLPFSEGSEDEYPQNSWGPNFQLSKLAPGMVANPVDNQVSLGGAWGVFASGKFEVDLLSGPDVRRTFVEISLGTVDSNGDFVEAFHVPDVCMASLTPNEISSEISSEISNDNPEGVVIENCHLFTTGIKQVFVTAKLPKAVVGTTVLLKIKRTSMFGGWSEQLGLYLDHAIPKGFIIFNKLKYGGPLVEEEVFVFKHVGE